MQSMQSTDRIIDKSDSKNTEGLSITYGIDDNPPWYLCIFMALQVC